MVETGLYHPFSFVSRKDKIDQQTVWQTGYVDIILTGNFTSVTLCNLATDAVLATGTEVTYEVNGVEITAFRLTYEMTGTTKAYINIDDKYFSDGIIETVTSAARYDCILYFFSKNDCSNQYYDWDNDTDELKIGVTYASEITPVFENETRILITDKGKTTKPVRLAKRYRVEFVAPAQMINMLNGMKLNTSNSVLSQYDENPEIINIEIEAQEYEGRMSKFTLTFEFKETLTDGNTCCQDVSLDTIITPETPAGDCADFAVEISETDNELNVILTDEPEGDVAYKWYRNNVFLSAAETISVVGAGDYRVEVTIAGCRATNSWFKDNVCALFSIQTTKVLNEINATASNVPDGETVTWSVVFDGSEVSDELPYTCEASGIYYIYATAGSCQKAAGIFVQLLDDECTFDASIDEDGNTLTADTDAPDPTYLWELETSSGRTEIGSTESITATGSGIYWLTVTNGECSKEAYLYKEPGTTQMIWVGTKISGTETPVIEIDVDSITNPAFELEVSVNGVLQTYVSPTPLTAGQYGISSGKITFGSTLTNATIKVIKR